MKNLKDILTEAFLIKKHQDKVKKASFTYGQFFTLYFLAGLGTKKTIDSMEKDYVVNMIDNLLKYGKQCKIPFNDAEVMYDWLIAHKDNYVINYKEDTTGQDIHDDIKATFDSDKGEFLLYLVKSYEKELSK